MRTRLTAFVILLTLALSVTIYSEDQSTESLDMNTYVMRVVESFPTDGSFPYWWPKTNVFDGATSDVFFLGERVMRGDPEEKGRCYCCGLTLQVFYHALDEFQDEGNTLPESSLTTKTTKRFQHYWFCPSLNSPGAVLALEEFGIGTRIKNLDEAQPGDFIQFWRNSGSGHSVIFIDWVKDDEGTITGLKYWSTQKATDGIGYRIEPVGEGEKDITRERIFIGRLLPPDQWESGNDEE